MYVFGVIIVFGGVLLDVFVSFWIDVVFVFIEYEGDEGL